LGWSSSVGRSRIARAKRAKAAAKGVGPQTVPTTTKGEITYFGTSSEGRAVMETNPDAEQPLKTTMIMSGHRIGDCP
jgi:hypothetical protein